LCRARRLVVGAPAIGEFIGCGRKKRAIRYWCSRGWLPVEQDERGRYTMSKRAYAEFLQQLRMNSEWLALGIPAKPKP